MDARPEFDSGETGAAEPRRRSIVETWTEVVADAGVGPLLRRQTAVGRGRRMGDGGLGVTQVGGDRNDFRRIDKAPGRLLAPLDLKADHGTEGTLLTLGQFMLRMAGQACVIHVLDAWLLLQP